MGLHRLSSLSLFSANLQHFDFVSLQFQALTPRSHSNRYEVRPMAVVGQQRVCPAAASVQPTSAGPIQLRSARRQWQLLHQRTTRGGDPGWQGKCQSKREILLRNSPFLQVIAGHQPTYPSNKRSHHHHRPLPSVSCSLSCQFLIGFKLAIIDNWLKGLTL